MRPNSWPADKMAGSFRFVPYYSSEKTRLAAQTVFFETLQTPLHYGGVTRGRGISERPRIVCGAQVPAMPAEALGSFSFGCVFFVDTKKMNSAGGPNPAGFVEMF
jgi:hypothetical protein